MSRSGYSDDLDPLDLGRWRGNVDRALKGKRGQAFLRELLAELDAMPDKRLIADEVVDDDGCACTLGVVVQSRGVDPDRKLDLYDPETIAAKLGIARPMAAEIIYENDEFGGRCVETHGPLQKEWHHRRRIFVPETPEARWQRMRGWVASKIKSESGN